VAIKSDALVFREEQQDSFGLLAGGGRARDGKSDNANSKTNNIASPDALIVESITWRLLRIIGCTAGSAYERAGR
jgi:hypothetical protein